MTEPSTTVATPTPASPPLAALLPDEPLRDADEILDRFLTYVGDIGFDLYPAQEEALLELMAGRHVILNTPTGSGKSLVALGLHFKALCEGRTSYYTSPIKALASEKFFSLCNDLGAEKVGMLTGDASINAGAPIVCCTAEVLANMALRTGASLDAPYVVMDEFHYYSDPERGIAWQVPLIILPTTRFLLMSATLGDMTAIRTHLQRQTRFDTALVTSAERPVPLEFEYRETSIHETVEGLVGAHRAPVYIVNFTQRECAELAQALTSAQVATRERRDRIKEAIRGYRFDTTYGKEFRRFLSFGIGVHHGGLLPKYRRLVEQLSQQGLLQVISGTDTLGVGVNIPIRTVLFSKLAKYDGQKVGILSVRDFQQISGRAGRKGFDDRGWVVCQAPEHVIENKKLDQKAAENPKHSKKYTKRKQKPPEGQVFWNKETFESLQNKPPETLQSRFRIDHGLVLNLIQRDAESDDPESDNFSSLRKIIADCHEDDATKRKLLSEAAVLVRSLYRANILKMVPDRNTGYRWVVVNEHLQWDFSLYHALSLYLVETLAFLDLQSETYPLELLSLVESILENPRVILYKMEDKVKGALIAQWKAEGVEYEERMARLEEVTYPKPLADFIYRTFDDFRSLHPWVRGDNIKPKGIGREMVEEYQSFADFIKKYGLQRSEGVVLRYLSQLFKTLSQTVPDDFKTEDVWDVLGFFRTMLERIDTSLLEEWEGMRDAKLHPELEQAETPEERKEHEERMRAFELLHDPRAFKARVRSELFQLVRALSKQDWEEASRCVARPPGGPEAEDLSEAQRRWAWTPERFEEALAPFLEEYEKVLFTPQARQAHWTQIHETGDRTWGVTQVLLDPEGDNLWHLAGEIDLTDPGSAEGPLVRLREVGT